MSGGSGTGYLGHRGLVHDDGAVELVEAGRRMLAAGPPMTLKEGSQSYIIQLSNPHSLNHIIERKPT
jgi:hypothetical protein